MSSERSGRPFPERILTAALSMEGVVWTLPRPARHCHLVRACVAASGVDRVTQEQQGFETSRGRFVDREEAARIALAAGQIAEPKGELFSEDLW